MKTRENRKIAIKWAVQQATRNGSLIMSDQFWSAFNNITEITAAVNKLNKQGIAVFAGVGSDGAILVHRDNPKVNIKDGYGLWNNVVNGEAHLIALHPWQSKFMA
jgi:hypothetical protein